MVFRTYKHLELIMLPMLMLSCAFFKKPQSVHQDSNTGKPISDEKLHLISGKISNKNCQS